MCEEIDDGCIASTDVGMGEDGDWRSDADESLRVDLAMVCTRKGQDRRRKRRLLLSWKKRLLAKVATWLASSTLKGVAYYCDCLCLYLPIRRAWLLVTPASPSLPRFRLTQAYCKRPLIQASAPAEPARNADWSQAARNSPPPALIGESWAARQVLFVLSSPTTAANGRECRG